MKVLRIIITIMLSLVVSSCAGHHMMSFLRQNTMVVWLDRQYFSAPGRLYFEEYPPERRIDCKYRYKSQKEKYQCVIVSDSDTVEFEFLKPYVQTNADSVNIMIEWATDSSSIRIHPICYWEKLLGGWWFIRGGMNDYCTIKSTRPIHMDVYFVVDRRKNNKNKDIFELLEEEYEDKIRRTVDSVFKKEG